MQSEVLAAIIGGAAGTLISTLTALFQRKRVNAEINKLAAETEHLREETEAAKKRPLALERKAYETVLAAFLDPFDRLLEQNKLIYDALLPERQALEYHPKALAKFFASLPNNGRRKLYWYQRIERLRRNNRRILALIQQYGSRIVTEGFRDACADFRYHADEWEDVWKAVEPTHIRIGHEEEVAIGDPIPGTEIVHDGGQTDAEALYANRFPESIREALNKEADSFRSVVSGTNQLGPQQSIPPQSLS